MNDAERDTLNARIRTLEAITAVQRLGLQKASSLIAEFQGGNIEAVATDIGEWIEYGLTTPDAEAYENRVRGLVDLLEAVSGFLAWIAGGEGFLQGADEGTIQTAVAWGHQIRLKIQELPPLHRGSVCKLTLNCPDHHTRDCRAELEKRFSAAPSVQMLAADFADSIVKGIAPAFTDDLFALAALAQAIRVELVEEHSDDQKAAFNVPEQCFSLPRAAVKILDRHWERYGPDGRPVHGMFEIPEHIITDAAAASGVPVPQTAADLQFFGELMQAISFEQGETDAKGRTWVNYAAGLLGLDAPSLAILARYARLKQKSPDIIQTEDEEGKPS